MFYFRAVLSVLSLVLVGAHLSAGPGCGHHHHGEFLSAQHGGVTEHAENTGLVLELLANEDNVEVYVFDSDMHPLPSDTVAMSGVLELPRRLGGASDLPLAYADGAYTAAIDIPSRARYYKIRLSVTHREKQDEVVFTVEP